MALFKNKSSLIFLKHVHDVQVNVIQVLLNRVIYANAQMISPGFLLLILLDTPCTPIDELHVTSRVPRDACADASSLVI